MPDANDQPIRSAPPPWAVAQASDEAEDGESHASTIDRARQLQGEAQQLDQERHDEYDDLDEGGEG